MTPAYLPDFEAQKRWLYKSFLSAAQERLGAECAAAVQAWAREYSAENDDAGFLKMMEG